MIQVFGNIKGFNNLELSSYSGGSGGMGEGLLGSPPILNIKVINKHQHTQTHTCTQKYTNTHVNKNTNISNTRTKKKTKIYKRKHS